MENTTQLGRIRRTPGILGGDARVRDTRIAVSVLVQLRQQGRTDDQLVHDFPGLTQDDLIAAWEYFREHPDEIERTIAADAGDE